jgi:23S rRNA (cytosine1962-C5)-methyltransferase
MQHITLKPTKERSVQRFHPWIFSGAIKQLPANILEGELVRVLSANGAVLGAGYYQIGSISVRMLSFEDVTIDEQFWREKLRLAIAHRQSLGMFDASDTNVFRLIHGEADGLPGLIVDYYNGCLVFQAHTVGMYRLKETLCTLLKELLDDDCEAIYDKSEHALPHKADLDPKDGFWYGDGDDRLVVEYGNKYKVNVVTGQKTGFFVDQRENRVLLGKYSRGRKVLNTFCYTGGFSVAALRAGASLVHSVDSSQKAIDLTDENVAINFGLSPQHQSFCADVFTFLNDMPEQYDVIVLDPPAFAKHLKVLKNGLKGYATINEKAMRNIKPGGILFTFSCSQVVSQQDFRTAIFTAALRANRQVQIIEQLHQPADHPVSLYHPEGEYLKGLVLRVI